MTDDRKELPDDLYNTKRWNPDRLLLLSDQTGIPIEELEALQKDAVAQWEKRQAKLEAPLRPWYEQRKAAAQKREAEAKAHQEEKERLDQEFAELKRAKTAHEVLEFPPLRMLQASEFMDTLPMVDGQRVNDLLDEEERLAARIAAIREELADLLGQDCKYRFGRKYVRTRGREHLRSDAATIVLMSWLGALGLADWWEHAYKLICQPVFGWKPTLAKLFPQKMREE